ncbi:hypothetical protein B0H14DRAFT_2934806 [Mycena olivaceomarginata]|nr:hypothetical protein B0H14DRAFT_2934806 [Mycena olivaceomarginata]
MRMSEFGSHKNASLKHQPLYYITPAAVFINHWRLDHSHQNMDTLGSTLGALFIGLVISSVLHGVTLAQAGYYFGGQKRFRDPVPLRILVSLIVTLDLVHQVCTSNWIYIFCVTKFGDTAGLAILPPSYLGMAYPTGFVTFIVQGFYVWRVWKLANQKLFVPAGILVCSCAQQALQLYSMSVIGKNPDSTQFSGSLKNVVIAVNAIGAGVDILIALAMMYFLGSKHSEFRGTKHILTTIATYSVTTGALTSICAILVLTMAITLPNTEYVLTFYLLLTRMYTNSLLATLNVRKAIGTSSEGVLSLSMNNIRSDNATISNTYCLEELKGERQPQSMADKVQTDIEHFH